MDGENKGKPYEQMDDLGGFYHPYFWFNTHILSGKFTQKRIWTILGASYHKSFQIPMKKFKMSMYIPGGFDPNSTIEIVATWDNGTTLPTLEVNIVKITNKHIH